MTKKIQKALCESLAKMGHQALCENFDYMVSEMDVASLSKSGLIHEFEVKISRADFKADKKKTLKFKYYEMRHEPYCPNYFYYVCPEGLIKKEEIPDYAGLYYYSKEGLWKEKNAKRLHNSPVQNLEKVLRKMLRLNIQRKYLGYSWMTFKNKEAQKRWEEHSKTKDNKEESIFSDT